jgi:hypothetical protein
MGFSFATESGDTNKSRMVTTIPAFFTFGVFMLLAVGIFTLFRAYDSMAWKLGVTALALTPWGSSLVSASPALTTTTSNP